MTEQELWEIADAADMIIAGYAFTAAGDFVRVLNLNHPESAAVIGYHDEVIETTMCDIEVEIVEKMYRENKEFMEPWEDENA